ncbi:MAG: hypothetical protein U9N59_00080 [Campylobacterota bacterium]|nr:hypothetical protein [Campylobacterota bacterium]
MGLFWKYESNIIKYGGQYSLELKFKRFGDYFSYASKDSSFLRALNSLALEYFKASKEYLNKVDINVHRGRLHDTYAEAMRYKGNPKNSLYHAWDSVLSFATEEIKEDTSHYYCCNYRYWIGDLNTALYLLDDYLYREGVIDDNLMYWHFQKINKHLTDTERGYPPRKENCMDYWHLSHLVDSKISNTLSRSISKESCSYEDEYIFKFVSVLENKKIEDIPGQVTLLEYTVNHDDYPLYGKLFNTFRVHFFTDKDIYLECENLLYVLIARDFVLRYHNGMGDSLNFPNSSIKELLEYLELYGSPNDGHYSGKRSFDVYCQVMDMTGSEEKTKLAKEQYESDDLYIQERRLSHRCKI